LTKRYDTNCNVPLFIDHLSFKTTVKTSAVLYFCQLNTFYIDIVGGGLETGIVISTLSMSYFNVIYI